jgi:hypothetical protein
LPARRRGAVGHTAHDKESGYAEAVAIHDALNALLDLLGAVRA